MSWEDNEVEGGLGGISDDDFGDDGTIDDDAGSDTGDGASDSGTAGSDSGSSDGGQSWDDNRIDGGLGSISDDDFGDDGTIDDDVGGGGTTTDPSPSPDQGTDTPEPTTDPDSGTGQTGSAGGTSGSDGSGDAGGESWEESRVEGGLDDFDDSDFDDDGTVRDSVNEDGATTDESTEQGARVRDDLPEEVARAGRVPGGLSGIDFDEGGTAVLEETPDEQGIETGEGSQAERARQLEDELVSDSNLTEQEVRVVQNYEGRLRARPTESYERDIEQQAAEDSAITVAGYEADVDRDFSAETEITDQGEQQLREEVSSQIGAIEDPGAVELVRKNGQIRARPTAQARDAIAASVASQSSLIDRSEVRVGPNFGATLTQSAQQDLEAAYAEQYGVEQSVIDVTARGQLTEQSQARVTQIQANRQYRQQGYYDLNSQQQAGEQEIFIGPNADYPEMEGVSTQQVPTRSTQAPESFSRASNRGPTDMGAVSLPTTGITVDPEVRRKIESGLENKTGTDLSREDYRVLPTDQGYRASLTEKGKEQVEVSNTPLKDVPVVGGVLTTGTRARQEIRDATDPFANWWEEHTPSKGDIWGAAAAGAPIAVGEPTPAGEAVLATLVGGALLTDAAVRNRDKILGEDPQASTSIQGGEIEQPTGPQDRSELEAPDERAGQGQGTSEMQVPDNQQSRSELEVPEEETTVQPEELGVPRDAVQSGEVDITGPEGTQITDEGDIVIPARTTQVAREKRYEEEQKEEDKQNDEEDDQQNEDEVIVEVPEELLPDEEVTIGEPEQPAEEEEEPGQSEEDVPSEPRDYQGVDDAVPEDTISEEEFVDPEVSDGEFVSDQASVIDIGLGIGAGAVTSPPGEQTVPATGGREDALDLLDEVLNVGVGEQQEEATDATSDLAPEVTQTPTVDQQLRLRGQLDQGLKQALSTQTQTTQQTQQQQQRTQTQQQFDTPYEYQTTTTKKRKKREESEEKKGSNGSEDSESNLVVGDRQLDIGWLNETVADIATKRGAVGVSPSQRRLRREPEPVQLTEQRATSLALSGSRSQQQRVAAVKDFLSFGVAGEEGSDGQPQADPLADRRQQPPARESGIGALAGGDQSGGDDRDQDGLGLDLVGGSSSNGDGGDENPLSVDVDLL